MPNDTGVSCGQDCVTVSLANRKLSENRSGLGVWDFSEQLGGGDWRP